MAKCEKCRSASTHALLGDNVSCVTCGHTGPAAPSPTPVKKSKKAAE